MPVIPNALGTGSSPVQTAFFLLLEIKSVVLFLIYSGRGFVVRTIEKLYLKTGEAFLFLKQFYNLPLLFADFLIKEADF